VATAIEPIDFWRLCNEYSVVQAALLIVGVLPEDLEFAVEHAAKKPTGYVAVRTALVNAIRSEELEATIVYEQGHLGDPMLVDLHQTRIHVRDLDAFVKSKRMICAVFDREELAPAELDPGAAHYPPKLDAALRAWRAVTGEPERLRGKSPKQAIEKWLLEHAGEVGLLNKDGRPNRNGIEEICKVANWKPEGGATPTPATAPTLPRPSTLTRLPEPRKEGRPEALSFPADLDDEIPF